LSIDGSLWLPPSCRRRSSATPSRRFAIASRCDRRGARSPSCSQLSWCRRANAPERYRQAEAVDGQHLVESVEGAGSDTGRLLIKAAGEIAQQPLGLIGIVELPSLPEDPAYRCMQRLGQPLDHVAGFMKLATLDRCVGAEGATDDFAQRLG